MVIPKHLKLPTLYASNLSSLLIFFKLLLYFVMHRYYPFRPVFISLTIKYVAKNVTLITLTTTKGHARIKNWVEFLDSDV